jgi:GNAT superfamily N-acetyltransferase
MSGYRFCRTDDVALLVDTYERCRGPELADDPPLTVKAFKKAAREIGLWASSCMLAIEGDEAVGVLLGAKNAAGNFVRRIAVRPDHQRRGHGRHMLESLRNKVAILGPPRLTAEVPAAWSDACRFFERAGFSEETRYTDLIVDHSSAAPSGLAEPLSTDDLAPPGSTAWEHSVEVLRRRTQQLEALAIASDVQIEAQAVYQREPSDRTDVVSLSFTRRRPRGTPSRPYPRAARRPRRGRSSRKPRLSPRGGIRRLPRAALTDGVQGPVARSPTRKEIAS